MADGIFVGLPHRWEQLLKVSSCDLNFPLPNPGTTGRPVFQDGKKHGHGLPWSIGRMSEVKISQVPCCFSIFPRPETSPKVAKVFQVLLPGSLTCRSKLGWIPKRKEQILFQPSILPQINSLSNFRGGYDLPFGMWSFFHSPTVSGVEREPWHWICLQESWKKSWSLSSSQSQSSPNVFNLQMKLSEVDHHHKLAYHFWVGRIFFHRFPGWKKNASTWSDPFRRSFSAMAPKFCMEVFRGFFGECCRPRSTTMWSILPLQPPKKSS